MGQLARLKLLQEKGVGDAVGSGVGDLDGDLDGSGVGGAGAVHQSNYEYV